MGYSSGATPLAWDASDIFAARYNGRSWHPASDTDAGSIPLPALPSRVDPRTPPKVVATKSTDAWSLKPGTPLVMGDVLQGAARVSALRVEAPKGSPFCMDDGRCKSCISGRVGNRQGQRKTW